MPSYIDFSPGQRIRVVNNSGTREATYESVVRHISDDGMRIDHPRRDGQRLELWPEDELQLAVELHGRLYTFMSAVRAVEEVPAEIVTIDLPEEVDHQERRNFFRLITRIEPRYTAVTNAEGAELELLDATILDISGGGMQLLSKQPVEVGARIRVIFPLAVDSVEADVIVLALSVQHDGRRSAYRINTRFADLPREIQERIIRFVFSAQLELLKKGVL